MGHKLEEIFNLPDIKFIQFCEWKFQLNRGVYNNIDIWFYEKGVKSIISRRKVVINFLFFACSNEKKVKFGSDGLKKKLEEFCKQSNNALLETVDQVRSV